MKRLVALAAVLLIAGCGGKHTPEPINPYADRAEQWLADGTSLLAARRFADAARTFHRAAVQASLAGDLRLLAQATRAEAVAILQGGDPIRAERLLRKAKAWAEDAGDEKERARASAWLLLARTSAQQLAPDQLSARPRAPMDALLVWAEAARRLGRLQEASEAFEAVARRAKSPVLQAEAHLGLAHIAQALREPAKALIEAKKAKDAAQKGARPRALADALAIIAALAQGNEAADAAAHASMIYQALQMKEQAKRMHARLTALAEQGSEAARLWLEDEGNGDRN